MVTSLLGIFVVGDAATQIKQVTGAMFGGVCAAAGTSMQLATEEGKKALEAAKASSGDQ